MFKRNNRLSFAWRSRAAQPRLLRSNGPAFWNLSIGGLSFRGPWSPPVTVTGPNRCYGWNVVGPGRYSKRFFCVPIGLYRGNLRPDTARGMPARSALGGETVVNPEAVIKASISL